jgi:hypothetical protein
VVSSGDNGSAGCDPTGTSPNAAINGVAVSGIASTPFNIAAGGTDFDPSTQNSTYWNPTSGTVNSALKYMPETTWNDSACAINYPPACTTVDSQGSDVVGAGGGPSNCAIGTSSSCNSGYPKPAYQMGLTPNTAGYTTRLIPDISLFSSNGQNGVALVVCQSDVNPGGAACNLNSPYQDFSLVGGTSAATPAFAAIIALVNQKTGQRQGNANFALYGLAKLDSNYASGKCAASFGQTPAAGCVFNDVTKGNDSVACVASSANCSNTTATGFGVLIYQGNSAAFTAGNGYDLATGLGSINVSNLLTKWSTFSRSTTTTTIGAVNPASGTSGQTSFTIPVTVSPAPTTAGETVSVSALASDKTTVLGSFGPFSLTSGVASATSNLLPPATAYVQAYYAGDATLGASSSPAVALAVTGANQTSKTTVGFVTFTSTNTPILPPATGSVTAAYGSPYILQIVVTNSGGTACVETSGALPKVATPCPTGTVALTDNESALHDWPIAGQVNATNIAKLNGEGIAEDQPIQLNAGSHSIQAAFTTGDANFQSSSSNVLSVTISQAQTATTVASSATSITSGQSVTLTAQVSTTSNGEAPCGITNSGTVQFTLDGAAISGAVSYTPTSGAASSTGTASCLATLSTTISGLYPPPSGRPRFRVMPLWPLTLLSVLLLAVGLKWIPRTRRRVYVYAGMSALMLAALAAAGCGGGGGSSGGGKDHTIGATYGGDTNYTKSVAPTIQIRVM